ncbi:hypothetical protein, partial [Mycobacteroides abscessus]|uniref:hypothetical protein n=1 Tax=Mycobacteroides abscessus TaxID=36809 RepID=UPI001A9702B6
ITPESLSGSLKAVQSEITWYRNVRCNYLLELGFAVALGGFLGACQLGGTLGRPEVARGAAG